MSIVYVLCSRKRCVCPCNTSMTSYSLGKVKMYHPYYIYLQSQLGSLYILNSIFTYYITIISLKHYSNSNLQTILHFRDLGFHDKCQTTCCTQTRLFRALKKIVWYKFPLPFRMADSTPFFFDPTIIFFGISHLNSVLSLTSAIWCSNSSYLFWKQFLKHCKAKILKGFFSSTILVVQMQSIVFVCIALL